MSEKQGCSTIVVVMISTLALIVGALGGALGMWYFAPQSEATAPAADAATTAAAMPEPAGQSYALLYPLEESLRIEGALPADAVKNKVKDRRFPLRKCYQDALEKDASLKGEMSLQFTVSGDTGKVIAAVERHTDIGNAQLKKCILDEIKSWELAKTGKGDSVVKFDVALIPLTGGSMGAP